MGGFKNTFDLLLAQYPESGTVLVCIRGNGMTDEKVIKAGVCIRTMLSMLGKQLQSLSRE